jgi:hypothetical protein
MGNVKNQANEAHILPSTTLLFLSCIGSGTFAAEEAILRLVITVLCVPKLSVAHENLALGIRAALPAMERLFLEPKVETSPY